MSRKKVAVKEHDPPQDLGKSLDAVSKRRPRSSKASPGSDASTKSRTDEMSGRNGKSNESAPEVAEASDRLFDIWDAKEFEPTDLTIDVNIDSLESAVGYSSLFRQMHQAFIRTVAYHRSPIGGSLSIEEARKRAFHACTDEGEAKERFSELMGLPLERLNFVDLMELQSFSPRVAERFWEHAKREGRKEFESGHLAANITFPVGYMKQVWNIARYIGVRESFVDDWNPQGGIEVSLIDMLAQSYFQWQFWLEQTNKRSQTKEREQHPEYARWMAQRKEEYRINGWTDGHWFRPFVTEQQAVEHAVQMADRWNRIFMRTLRQLRDLRRYSPVTINNPNQVNIAADGGQQINVAD